LENLWPILVDMWVVVGARTMAGYRIYFLDGSGHFTSAEDIECETDSEALAALKKLEHHCGVELWQKGRRIAVLGPRDTEQDTMTALRALRRSRELLERTKRSFDRNPTNHSSTGSAN
jgi:hypothetical protein